MNESFKTWFDQAGLVSPQIKNLPANAGGTRDTGSISVSGRSPGKGNSSPGEDHLEKEIAMGIHSRILAWRIPWTRGAWWATVEGSQRLGHS